VVDPKQGGSALSSRAVGGREDKKVSLEKRVGRLEVRNHFGEGESRLVLKKTKKGKLFFAESREKKR